MKSRSIILLVACLSLVVAACGGGDGEGGAASPPAAATDPAATDPATTARAATGPPAEGPGGDSTVTLGDEVIALDGGPGCYTEPQDTAGGGQILVTAQLSGTTAAGEPVLIDFTRYDEESMFTGDDVSLAIGTLDSSTGDYSVGDYSVKLELGAAGDGVLQATDFTWESDELGTAPGAFTIHC